MTVWETGTETGCDAAKEAVSIYFLAGLATSPTFMESFRVALHGILAREGYPVRDARLLFPYGDWSRSVFPQLWEICLDMRLRPRQIGGSIGGKRAVEAIGERWHTGPADKTGTIGDREPFLPGEGGRVVLIGHSGGGIAAVHAACLLRDLIGGPPSPVVMIGSPRCRIPEELRSSVLFAYAAAGGEFAANESTPQGAARRGAKPTDPISRLGTFGGWRGFGHGGGISAGDTLGDAAGEAPGIAADGRISLSRRRSEHAPGHRAGIPIIGKHADYFREREPYVNGLGLTNLQMTLGVVWPWLRERI